MKLIEPYARMISPLIGYPDQNFRVSGRDFIDSTTPFTPRDGHAMLRKVEWAARISHRSEDAITDMSWKKIIDSVVMNHGDMSVIEHATITVEAYVDRGITHEWVRHRLFSYTQESTRFVNYVKKMLPSFVKPKFTLEQEAAGAGTLWDVVIDHIELTYVSLIEAGCAPQVARSIFPNALASKIVVTGNLRSWRHFFIMRASLEAHPQMKQVSLPLLEEFQWNIPILFDDIKPNQRQADNMRLLR